MAGEEIRFTFNGKEFDLSKENYGIDRNNANEAEKKLWNIFNAIEMSDGKKGFSATEKAIIGNLQSVFLQGASANNGTTNFNIDELMIPKQDTPTVQKPVVADGTENVEEKEVHSETKSTAVTEPAKSEKKPLKLHPDPDLNGWNLYKRRVEIPIEGGRDAHACEYIKTFSGKRKYVYRDIGDNPLFEASTPEKLGKIIKVYRESLAKIDDFDIMEDEDVAAKRVEEGFESLLSIKTEHVARVAVSKLIENKDRVSSEFYEETMAKLVANLDTKMMDKMLGTIHELGLEGLSDVIDDSPVILEAFADVRKDLHEKQEKLVYTEDEKKYLAISASLFTPDELNLLDELERKPADSLTKQEEEWLESLKKRRSFIMNSTPSGCSMTGIMSPEEKAEFQELLAKNLPGSKEKLTTKESLRLSELEAKYPLLLWNATPKVSTNSAQRAELQKLRAKKNLTEKEKQRLRALMAKPANLPSGCLAVTIPDGPKAGTVIEYHSFQDELQNRYMYGSLSPQEIKLMKQLDRYMGELTAHIEPTEAGVVAKSLNVQKDGSTLYQCEEEGLPIKLTANDPKALDKFAQELISAGSYKDMAEVFKNYVKTPKESRDEELTRCLAKNVTNFKLTEDDIIDLINNCSDTELFALDTKIFNIESFEHLGHGHEVYFDEPRRKKIANAFMDRVSKIEITAQNIYMLDYYSDVLNAISYIISTERVGKALHSQVFDVRGTGEDERVFLKPCFANLSASAQRIIYEMCSDEKHVYAFEKFYGANPEGRTYCYEDTSVAYQNWVATTGHDLMRPKDLPEEVSTDPIAPGS